MSAGAPSGGESRGRPWANLGVVFLTVFIDIVGFSIIFPLFPDMLEYYFEREGSESLLGGLMHLLTRVAGGEGAEGAFRAQVLFGGVLGTLYSLLQFLFAPLWGSVSDRAGRKPVLILTISGLALSYLLWFFSADFELLIVARCFGGAMAANIVVASAAVVDSTDARNRAKGMGMLGAALGLGFVLGPAIGSALAHVDVTEWTGDRLGINPFSAAAGAAFLLSLWNLVWVKRRFRETLPEEVRGRVRTTERTASPLRLFRRWPEPGINRTNLAYFVFFLAFAGMEFTITFLAKGEFAYTSRTMFWIFLYIGGILILVQGGLVRRLSPRYGEKNVALAGLACVPPGLVLTGLSGVSGSQAMLYGGLGLLALGSGLAIPTLASLVSLYAPRHRQGEVQGIFRSLGALARAVGPVAACAVYFRYGAPALYIAGAALCLAPLAIASALPRPRASEGDDDEDAPTADRAEAAGERETAEEDEAART